VAIQLVEFPIDCAKLKVLSTYSKFLRLFNKLIYYCDAGEVNLRTGGKNSKHKQMIIEIFTLADYAADGPPGKLTIVGTFDTYFCQQVPLIIPNCSVALRIRFANSEAGNHDIKIKFRGPKPLDIPDFDGKLQVFANPNADYSTSNLVINLSNAKISSFGKHTIELWVNGEFESGLSLHIVKVDPAQLRKVA
jgi:hypothetical protein